MNISRFTLPNGLRVVHHLDTSTAMVALNVLYDVGARDESPEMTGMAHLFEHLMFGGSVNIPDFDYAIEQAGGTDNAWTSNDFTNFYDVVPAANAETAFWLESDRMLSLAFSEKALEVQRSVVTEEFKQTTLNRPYGDLMHHLRSLAFERHPYRSPVIGLTPAHIEKVSQTDVMEFYFNHYSPANAVLVVSGNLPFDRTLHLAEKWLGPIDRRDTVKRDLPVEPAQTTPRRKEVIATVPQTAITIAFKMGGYGSRDYRAADILTDILASGRSSRFYRNLVLATDLFTEADASILGSEDPGLLMINARLTRNDDKAVSEAERLILSQLSEIADNGVTQHELDRALNRFESDNTFANLSYLSIAQALAMAEIHGENLNSYVENYRALTAEDINRAAGEILSPQLSSTLIYRPQ